MSLGRKAQSCLPVYTAAPTALQHLEYLMPGIPLLCSDRPGKKWACWPCCAHLVNVLRCLPWQKGWWKGQPSLLQLSTLTEPVYGYLLTPETQDLQPGYNWNHCQEKKVLQIDKENRLLKGQFCTSHTYHSHHQKQKSNKAMPSLVTHVLISKYAVKLKWLCKLFLYSECCMH